MPTYTFRCPNCFYSTDISVSYQKYPIDFIPPVCGDGTEMERVYKRTPVKYIGEGFATNDLKEGNDNE